MVLFADDSSIFCSGDDLELLLKVITAEMRKLKIWFNGNKLSLILNKTKIMLLGNWTTDIHVQIQIGGVNTERVCEHKFLWLTIDENIYWKPHET